MIMITTRLCLLVSTFLITLFVPVSYAFCGFYSQTHKTTNNNNHAFPTTFHQYTNIIIKTPRMTMTTKKWSCEDDYSCYWSMNDSNNSNNNNNNNDNNDNKVWVIGGNDETTSPSKQSAASATPTPTSSSSNNINGPTSILYSSLQKRVSELKMGIGKRYVCRTRDGSALNVHYEPIVIKDNIVGQLRNGQIVTSTGPSRGLWIPHDGGGWSIAKFGAFSTLVPLQE